MLPELAESQLNPPDVTDMRQDMQAFDNMFHLPAARMRYVITALAGTSSPWLLTAKRRWTRRWCTRSLPAPPSPSSCSQPALDHAPAAIAATVASLRLGRSLGDVISVSEAGQVGGEHCVSRAQAGTVQRRAAGSRQPPRHRRRRLR